MPSMRQIFQGIIMTSLAIAVISRVPALSEVVAPDWD
jgi:hypothetical protein